MYHNSFERCLQDLPWLGRRVRLLVVVRRFRCSKPQRPRKTFVELQLGVSARSSRETLRLAQAVRQVDYDLGGLPGARLLRFLGVATSDTTVLRRVKELRGREPSSEGARVLGVADWAWRKRLRYGTMLMDLEARRVIDPLPISTAASLKNWLSSHPQVEVIARDRSLLNMKGGRQGAPGAVQVHNRFHLVCNLAAAVEEDAQHRVLTTLRSFPRTVICRTQCSTRPRSVDETANNALEVA